MKPYFDSIDSLDIPNRAYNALKRAGLTSVRQIGLMSDDDLLCIRNLGTASLRAVRSAVPPVDIASVEEVPFPMTQYAPQQTSTTATHERTQQ